MTLLLPRNLGVYNAPLLLLGAVAVRARTPQMRLLLAWTMAGEPAPFAALRHAPAAVDILPRGRP